MARRVEGDRRRDNLRQRRELDALERRFQSRMAREIARSMRLRLTGLDRDGEIAADPDHKANVERVYQDMAAASITAFARRINASAKSRSGGLETKDFADTVARLARTFIMAEAVRRRIASVTDTTRAQIIVAVARGQEEGQPVDAVSRGIRELAPGISRQRGALIARTEVHGAANFGADSAARELGLTLRKEWVAAQDERTRLDHVDADGQVVGMESAFLVGGESLMFPGDPAGSATQTVNCRCSVSHIVVDE